MSPQTPTEKVEYNRIAVAMDEPVSTYTSATRMK